jgi:hypothetical protein
MGGMRGKYGACLFNLDETFTNHQCRALLAEGGIHQILAVHDCLGNRYQISISRRTVGKNDRYYSPIHLQSPKY